MEKKRSRHAGGTTSGPLPCIDEKHAPTCKWSWPPRLWMPMHRRIMPPAWPDPDEKSSQCRNRRLAVDDRRHPVCCVARRSGFARLTLKVVNRWNRREAPTILQAVHIDHRARSRRRFRDCRDEHTATAADQKIAGAGSEAVVLDQRPFVRPNLELPFEVRTMRGLWLRQNEHVHARSGLSSGGLESQDAHEYYRSDTRPNDPCSGVWGLAAPVSRRGSNSGGGRRTGVRRRVSAVLEPIAEPNHATLQHLGARQRHRGDRRRYAGTLSLESKMLGAPFAPSTAGQIARLISSIRPARRKAPFSRRHLRPAGGERYPFLVADPASPGKADGTR